MPIWVGYYLLGIAPAIVIASVYCVVMDLGYSRSKECMLAAALWPLAIVFFVLEMARRFRRSR